MNLAERTNADIVQGSFYKVDENGTKIGEQIAKNKDIDGDLFGYPWGKLFKAHLFKNIKFPERYWFEDTICSLLLFPMAQLKASTETPVYNYYINPHGITHTSRKNIKSLDSYYITKKLYEDRIDLDVPLIQSDYEHFLYQVSINHKRLMGLNNNKLQELVMYGHQSLRKKYFKNFQTNNSKLKIVETTLDSGKLIPFLFAIRLL